MEKEKIEKILDNFDTSDHNKAKDSESDYTFEDNNNVDNNIKKWNNTE